MTLGPERRKSDYSYNQLFLILNVDRSNQRDRRSHLGSQVSLVFHLTRRPWIWTKTSLTRLRLMEDGVGKAKCRTHRCSRLHGTRIAVPHHIRHSEAIVVRRRMIARIEVTAIHGADQVQGVHKVPHLVRTKHVVKVNLVRYAGGKESRNRIGGLQDGPHPDGLQRRHGAAHGGKQTLHLRTPPTSAFRILTSTS